MNVHPTYLNKQEFRAYPLNTGATLLSSDGRTLPVSLFTDLRITTVGEAQQLYVSQVFVSGLTAVVGIASTTTSLGVFNVDLTADYSMTALTAADGISTGTLTIGSVVNWQELSGSYSLGVTAPIEPSVVVWYARPNILAINSKGTTFVGNLTWSYNNIQEVISPSLEKLELKVLDTDLLFKFVEADPDKGTCPTPYILNINSVFPDPSGNIDIYGVLPVRIETAGQGSLRFNTDLVFPLDFFCQNAAPSAPPVYKASNGGPNIDIAYYYTGNHNPFPAVPATEDGNLFNKNNLSTYVTSTEWSKWSQFSPPTLAEGEPTVSRATPSALTTTLAWSRVEKAVGYLVYRSALTSSSTSESPSITSSSTFLLAYVPQLANGISPFVDDTVVADTRYRYWIKALGFGYIQGASSNYVDTI